MEIDNWTDEEKEAYLEWTKSRPSAVRAIAEKLNPWMLYRMKSTGQRVTLAAISEDGTVRVDITGEYNSLLFDRSVFGIDPDDLEPCDLPSAAEPVGTMMSPEEVDENIDAIRVAIRPDLFVMGDDGKARRKD